MKKNLLFIIVFISFTFSILAENQNKKVDWDKIENALYNKLKNETDKSEAEVHQAIGYSLLKVDNQWERASVHFKKAVKQNPSLYLSWYNLALIDIGNEIGYRYFKKAIEAKPDFAPPYYWIAYNYCRYYRDIEAVSAFKKYLEVAKKSNNPSEKGRMKVTEDVLAALKSKKEKGDIKKIRHPMPEKYAFGKVYINNGNIYFVNEKGKEIQYTSSGKDKEVILSPNKKQIVFVRQVEELKDNPLGIPENDAEIAFYNWSPYQIWTINIEEGKPQVLLKSYYKGSAKKENRGWFHGLSFSPDGKKIYYVCQPGCPTTHVIHSVNFDGTGDKWLHWGESVKVIKDKESKYYGYLIVERKADDGVYDIPVVLTTEGKEIGRYEEIFGHKG
jgi:tetratricopeptide (TPR) repeat protein